MPSLDRVADLIAQVRTFDLERPSGFDLATLEEIAVAYNGFGPEWLPKGMRDWLAGINAYFEPAALIHDWEYQFAPDRSREAFTACNERLRRNCRHLLVKGFPWYKRWYYRVRPELIADAVQELGWSAWLESVPEGSPS